MRAPRTGAAGVIRVLDGPLPPGSALAIAGATVVLLVAFTLGARYRVVAPLAALGLLWTLTYRNRGGDLPHRESARAPRARARVRAGGRRVGDRTRRAGRSARGGLWLGDQAARGADRDHLRARGHREAAARRRSRGSMASSCATRSRSDNLRKALLGDPHRAARHAVARSPAGFTGVRDDDDRARAVGADRVPPPRVARLWALAAWGFHVGVVLLMNIWFPFPLLGLAYLPLLRAERPFAWLLAWWRRRRRRGGRGDRRRDPGRAGNVGAARPVGGPGAVGACLQNYVCSNATNGVVTMSRATFPELTNAELRVIKALWQVGTGTVAEVRGALGERGKELAYTTVMTLLGRLATKGAVASTRPASRSCTSPRPPQASRCCATGCASSCKRSVRRSRRLARARPRRGRVAVARRAARDQKRSTRRKLGGGQVSADLARRAARMRDTLREAREGQSERAGRRRCRREGRALAARDDGGPGHRARAGRVDRDCAPPAGLGPRARPRSGWWCSRSSRCRGGPRCRGRSPT